jgi:predicted HicB family RNase H-like nuclease
MSPKGEYTDGKVKVTIRLDPDLVKTAKHQAIEQQTTLQALIEAALLQKVSRSAARRRR